MLVSFDPRRDRSRVTGAEVTAGQGLSAPVAQRGSASPALPVTFAVLDHAVVLRTAADTRLAAAADGAVRAFEVDEVDPVTRTGWSVVVTGVAEVGSERSAGDCVTADTS